MSLWWCRVCSLQCNSPLQYDGHCAGKRHAYNRRMQYRNINQRYSQQYESITSNRHSSQVSQRSIVCNSNNMTNKNAEDVKQNESDDDEPEVIVISAKKSIRCPLTLCIMQCPVKSSKCGHVFEEYAILNYIQQKSSLTCTCPIPGCNSYIVKEYLIEDLETKVLIENSKHEEKEKYIEIVELCSDSENEKSDAINTLKLPPPNYVCKKCEEMGKHWIMHCNIKKEITHFNEENANSINNCDSSSDVEILSTFPCLTID
eukprot:105806_1